MKFLEKNDLDIIWSVLGEKQIITGSPGGRDNYGWQEINGVFHLKQDKAFGVLRSDFNKIK